MLKLHALKGLVMWYLHRPNRIKGYIARNKRNEERIRQKDSITVVFFASNLSMWHYQGLYEEMLKYPRFKPYIVLSPLNAYAREQKVSCIEALREYFHKKGIDYIDYDTDRMKGYDVKGKLKPDILFYPQPYYTVMCKEHRYYRFKDSLLAYYPYYYRLSDGQYGYNEDFHNRAWRLYYESDFHKKESAKVAAVGDINVRVVGYPVYDDFRIAPIEVWKPQVHPRKRIIWAPHFTLGNDGWGGLASNFLWMSQTMVEIAERYQDRIQFAFKPHPRLKSELYKHPDWGEQKTDAYFAKWEKMDNTQLELGEYVNLFLTSDAMIHDSGSFAMVYLYTKKPVLYIRRDSQSSSEDNIWNFLMDKHYIAQSIEDIELFINEVVLKGIDPKKEDREKAYIKLSPENGKTVAENTIDDLIISLQTI